MALAEQILEANRAWASASFPGASPLAPARRLVVVSCMDSRIDVFAILGLHNGDAHIIRNAGGLVTDDVQRSIALSQRLLDTVDVVLVQHTDCAMCGFDAQGFRRQLREETGHTPMWDAPGFDDVDTSVRQQLWVIQRSPWLRHDGEVVGFVYDVGTGELRLVHQIVPAGPERR
jgi:carbonic anhydrase